MAKLNELFELSNAKLGNNGRAGQTTPVVAPPPTGNPERKKSEISTQKSPDTFVTAMLEEPSEEHEHRNPLEWVAALAFHLLLIAGLIIVPLYFTQTLNVKAFQSTWLVAPPPPAPAPPPPPAIPVRSVKSAPHLIETGKLTAPKVIPKQVAILKEAPPPPDAGPEGVIGGMPGGVPGGQVGGVLGGIIGGTGHAASSLPPPPATPSVSATKRIVRVGGNIKLPKQTYYEAPVYPVVAKQVHIQGTVVIDAVIDEHGSVVQARAVSGPTLLIPAALQTVLKWKYEPSYLNGEPISVEMHVTVDFVMQ